MKIHKSEHPTSPKRAHHAAHRDPHRPHRPFAELLHSRHPRHLPGHLAEPHHELPRQKLHPRRLADPQPEKTRHEPDQPETPIAAAAPLVRRESPIELAHDVAPADRPNTEPIHPIFDRIVSELSVAEDVHRRRTVFLELKVPGYGGLHVRIRRGRHGAEVAFRTADKQLRDVLRARRGELNESARGAGVSLSSVQVD